ncbi:hypothetical protein R1flu_016243 [Riccia fluitans]|uniref:Uncharacterized protein n=1 Tax=Riccia fluitans TaxID=41844 RepID=A0ABD1YPD9_9MARC
MRPACRYGEPHGTSVNGPFVLLWPGATGPIVRGRTYPGRHALVPRGRGIVPVCQQVVSWPDPTATRLRSDRVDWPFVVRSRAIDRMRP